MQKKMNGFLRLYKYFVKYYINNVIIFFKIIKKYFEYFRIIFRLFAQFKIIFKLKKSFLDYSFIIFLNQKMNNFDLIMTKKKIAIIKKIHFSKILKILKIYIDITN